MATASEDTLTKVSTEGKSKTISQSHPLLEASWHFFFFASLLSCDRVYQDLLSGFGIKPRISQLLLLPRAHNHPVQWKSCRRRRGRARNLYQSNVANILRSPIIRLPDHQQSIPYHFAGWRTEATVRDGSQRYVIPHCSQWICALWWGSRSAAAWIQRDVCSGPQSICREGEGPQGLAYRKPELPPCRLNNHTHLIHQIINSHASQQTMPCDTEVKENWDWDMPTHHQWWITGRYDATNGPLLGNCFKIRAPDAREGRKVMVFPHYYGDYGPADVLRGMRRFALTLSRSSSRVAASLGKSPLWDLWSAYHSQENVRLSRLSHVWINHWNIPL